MYRMHSNPGGPTCAAELTCSFPVLPARAGHLASAPAFRRRRTYARRCGSAQTRPPDEPTAPGARDVLGSGKLLLVTRPGLAAQPPAHTWTSTLAHCTSARTGSLSKETAKSTRTMPQSNICLAHSVAICKQRFDPCRIVARPSWAACRTTRPYTHARGDRGLSAMAEAHRPFTLHIHATDGSIVACNGRYACHS